ncbi:MAG: DUF2179 domain-containing protein [Methanomicrobiales archaeon]|nr:DUF2179 domain-containing protein [Methanomicrobiales archaeon]
MGEQRGSVVTIALNQINVFAYVILPLLIFIARIGDVSLDTIRVIFVARGFRYFAPVLGFFETSIWLLAIGQIFRDLSNPISYFAYAGGFATGTFVGMWLEDRLSIGTVMIRVVTQKKADELINQLKGRRYGVTTVDAMGALGSVQIILTIVQRTSVSEVVSLVRQFNPHAFYTIEDVRNVTEGIFPIKGDGYLKRHLRTLFTLRKEK